MTKWWLGGALVLVCSQVAAAGEPWSIVVPAGYTESREATDAALAEMRSHSRLHVDGHVYRDAAGGGGLVVMSFIDATTSLASWGDLEHFDGEVVSGLRDAGSNHVSDSRTRGSLQLVAESVDGIAGGQIHRRAIYGTTETETYMIQAQCVSPGAPSPACETALSSLRLELPGAVAPAEESESDRKRDPAYRLGYAFGYVIMAAIPIGLLIWFFRRDRAARRAKP